MIDYIKSKNTNIARVSEQKIDCLADALDLMATVYFNGCDRMTIFKDAFTSDFFDLRTGLLGEILQKFSTYGMRLAIVGDFGNIQSKALRDFIRESNKGNQVFFVATEEEAVAALVKGL